MVGDQKENQKVLVTISWFTTSCKSAILRQKPNKYKGPFLLPSLPVAAKGLPSKMCSNQNSSTFRRTHSLQDRRVSANLCSREKDKRCSRSRNRVFLLGEDRLLFKIILPKKIMQELWVSLERIITRWQRRRVHNNQANLVRAKQTSIIIVNITNLRLTKDIRKAATSRSSNNDPGQTSGTNSTVL